MKPISISKAKRIERDIRELAPRIAAARVTALAACNIDPDGDMWGPRATAIMQYCELRRWRTHYKNYLANHQLTKMANMHAVAR